MDFGRESSDSTTLRDYLNVVRRRKWIILQALVLVPAAAVFFSLQQERLYQATAEVLIGRQNLAASLTGTVDPTVYQQADRIIQTQASLARVPDVARRVLEEAGLAGSEMARGFLGRSSVSAKQNADLLEFKVTDRSPSRAAELATLYANQFKIYRREIDTASLERARTEVAKRIALLDREAKPNTALYAALVDKEQQLATMEALQTSNAFVVHSAEDAELVQPRPLRNGILGLALALVLGLGLAFLREALDTRVRSADELEQQLGMPLLARIPEPPRRLRKDNRLAMLANPRGVNAETFRMLKMNLEFMKLGRDARTIMVTSAVEQEGKSTTVANLAVALARAGESVCLVDLDLRRPYLDRFFDLQDVPGLTQLMLDQLSLDQALTPIVIPAPSDARHARGWRGGRSENGDGNGNGEHGASGLLHVLTAGAIPPNAGDLVVTGMVGAVLGELRERFGTVLIDAPPALQVGDAMALSSKVDGIFVVTRMNVVRRPMVRELRRVLDASPAAKLGFILTGAESEEGYGHGGYGYGYGYGTKRKDREGVRLG
jgi:Mrp family chromosome partitioning ATPase